VAARDELISFLDQLLDAQGFDDYGPNGLQVVGREDVRRVATGVSAHRELFERAATTLGQLGDEQHEGQVIANLALAFRRRGEDEKSEDALDAALAKLRPESDAYRKVQSLRRAS